MLSQYIKKTQNTDVNKTYLENNNLKLKMSLSNIGHNWDKIIDWKYSKNNLYYLSIL